eukprot:Gb_05972 [translate_table: standard]
MAFHSMKKEPKFGDFDGARRRNQILPRTLPVGRPERNASANDKRFELPVDRCFLLLCHAYFLFHSHRLCIVEKCVPEMTIGSDEGKKGLQRERGHWHAQAD